MSLDPASSLADLNVEFAMPPRTISEAVYRRFRQDILWGKLKPDMPLRSDELREVYQVGISPLREALQRLVGERLVVSYAQRGFRVAPLTIDDVVDVFETRLVLEGEGLSRSIRSGGLAWERDVVSAFHVLSKIPLPVGPGREAELWAVHHQRFHMALISGCGSRWIIALASSLFNHAERHRLVGFRSSENLQMRDPNAEHKRIMDAALSRNERGALAALDHHYRATAEMITALFAGDAAGEPDRVPGDGVPERPSGKRKSVTRAIGALTDGE